MLGSRPPKCAKPTRVSWVCFTIDDLNKAPAGKDLSNDPIKSVSTVGSKVLALGISSSYLLPGRITRHFSLLFCTNPDELKRAPYPQRLGWLGWSTGDPDGPVAVQGWQLFRCCPSVEGGPLPRIN